MHIHTWKKMEARQLAGKPGQTDRCDNAFVYEPATKRCMEMSKGKVQVGVSTIPVSYGLLVLESVSQGHSCTGHQTKPSVLL